jgi:GAF domain-containing protein
MAASPTADLQRLTSALNSGGLPAALRLLNARTPFRFTGVYRFDGDTLRNVALFDRWTPALTRGHDAPMNETFCAITAGTNEPLEVTDGHHDPRFPWMQANAVESYCGTPIRDAGGHAVGTLCHFDLKPCESISSELPLLAHAATLFLPFVDVRHA